MNFSIDVVFDVSADQLNLIVVKKDADINNTEMNRATELSSNLYLFCGSV